MPLTKAERRQVVKKVTEARRLLEDVEEIIQNWGLSED